MKIKDALTILIPLKGREKETRRLLKYLNDIEFPFKVLMADGGGSDLSSWINKENYPNVNLEYHNFGADTDINSFMKKMNKACSLIDTPLTMMVDNDDFVSLNGIIYGIKFLEENEGYVSYRGNISEMKSHSLYKMPSITDNSIIDRLKSSIENRNAGWHDIVRTYTLKKLFALLDVSGTQDLQLVLTMNTYWHMMYGKSFRCHNRAYYYHIPGNSLVQNKGIYSKYIKWANDGKFKSSMAICASMVGNNINILDGTDIEKSKKDFISIMMKDVFSKNGRETVGVDEVVELSNKYDESFLEILNQEDEMVTFNLSEEIGELNLDSGKDQGIIRKYL